MADIFFSYASGDRDRVRPIIHLLEQAGWSVWWDRDIAAGTGFELTIDREIQDARCVVVAWSQKSIASRWVRNEALEGLERDTLIPVLLENVRVPVAFRQAQSIDLSSQPTPESEESQALLGAVARLTATASTLPETIAPAPEMDRPSIAVLPFRAHALDPEESYLIDTLTEDLTARLAHTPGFFVIAAGTTLAFAQRTVDPVQVGRQLRVRYIVDGSLRRAGDRVRVNAQLTDTSTGTQIYAERIESTSTDLSVLEDELVSGLISSIEPELMRAEVIRISRQPPEKLDAWSLCRAGVGLLQTRGWHPDVLRESTELLDRAIRVDPDFALPWAGKAVILGVGSRLGFFDRNQSELRKTSLNAAERAIELAQNDSQVLGYAGCALADWGEAEQSMPVLDQAIQRNPSNAQAWVARGLAWRDLGELSQGIEEARTGLTLSPRDSSVAAWLVSFASMLMQNGQLQEASHVLREARQRDPRLFAAPLLVAVLSAMTGDGEAAIRAVTEARRLRPDLTRKEINRFGGALLMELLDEKRLLVDLPDT